MIRVLPVGSNPLSNGLVFSLSNDDLYATINKEIRIILIHVVTETYKKIWNIRFEHPPRIVDNLNNSQ